MDNPANPASSAESHTSTSPASAQVQHDEGANLPAPAAANKRKVVVLSLIRHAEHFASFCATGRDAPLTGLGNRQAERLGEEWKNVRIDRLLSSTLPRAYETAAAIEKENVRHPKVFRRPLLVEREYGEKVQSRAGYSVDLAPFIYGWDYKGGMPTASQRDFRPEGGGESLNDVARRAKESLQYIVHLWGKYSEDPLKSLATEFVQQGNPEVLPDLPHVVVVAHNIFLTELYEVLLNQNSKERVTSYHSYKNTGWSRHIVSIAGGEEDFALGEGDFEYVDLEMPPRLPSHI